MNSEKKKQYLKRYYQEHKDKYRQNFKKFYQRTKELNLTIGDIDFYQTREELKEAESRGEGKINWTAFDKVVEQTKQQITNALENFEQPLKRKPIYCYTLKTKLLIKTFKDSDEAATTLDINRMIVTNHARTQVPIYHKNIILSYTPINENTYQDLRIQ